jgi:hypothetical protein
VGRRSARPAARRGTGRDLGAAAQQPPYGWTVVGVPVLGLVLVLVGELLDRA